MDNLTPLRSTYRNAKAVHLGWDVGVDTVPLCGALYGRETETIDLRANCKKCVAAAHATGRDLDGLVELSAAMALLVEYVVRYAKANRGGENWDIVAGMMSDYEISVAIGRKRTQKGAREAVALAVAD